MGSLARRILAAVIVILVVLAIAACDSVQDGEVVDRSFEPAHTYTYLVCTKYSCIPITVNVPDTWRLHLVRDDGQDGWVAVPHYIYDHVLNGAYYDPKGPLNGPIKPMTCKLDDGKVRCHGGMGLETK